MYLQEITWVIAILSFIGGIAIFLFKKIVVEPLANSINLLNDTLKEFKLSTDRRMSIAENRIDVIEDRYIRHDEQIKTLFNQKGDA